eukprot:SAG11_NODE_28189_length_324_cov_1.146667_1_plen_100_part_01
MGSLVLLKHAADAIGPPQRGQPVVIEGPPPDAAELSHWSEKSLKAAEGDSIIEASASPSGIFYDTDVRQTFSALATRPHCLLACPADGPGPNHLCGGSCS